jgi:hypothetical protein
MSHIPATSNYSAAVNPAPGVSLCYLASHLPIFRHQLLKISLGLVLDAFNHIQLKVDYTALVKTIDPKVNACSQNLRREPSASHRTIVP